MGARTYLQIGDSTISTNSTKFAGGFIAKAIAENGKGLIEYLNLGIGSQTYTTFNTWGYSYCADTGAKLISVHLGMNDCLADSAGLAAFNTNAQAFIDKLLRWYPDAEIILVTPNGVGTGNTRLDAASGGGGTKIQVYRNAIEALATANDLYFADLTEVWTDGAGGTANTLDEVHPTDAGQQLIADYLMTIIETTDFYASL